MAGKAVTVRKDNQGQTLLDCIEDIPEDFPPCVVTDASVRVRETYNLQLKHRENVRKLTEAPKNYSSLKIHVWRKGSGKQVYKSNEIHKLADEVVMLIDNKPDESFLVIHHKPDKSGDNDIQKLILRQMNTDKERVKFIHYGNHTSTNKYSHISNIIVAGTLFYRVAEYESLGRASANRPTSGGTFGKDEENDVKKGESAHHLLQAICRGKVRLCIDNGCPKSNVWLIADPRTGIEELLPKIFPECKIDLWETKNVYLKNNLKKAYEFIKSRISSGINHIPLRTVREYTGIRDLYTFRRDILKKPEFQQKLVELGVIVEDTNRGRVFIKPDFATYFGDTGCNGSEC